MFLTDMKKVLFVLATVFAIFSFVSCGNRTAKHTSSTSTSATVKESVTTASSVIDSLPVSGDPFVLCSQVLTSEEALENLGGPEDNTYDRESTSDKYSYFYPEKDIKVTKDVEKLELMYNISTVYNHAIHSYELHSRKLSAPDDSLMTRKDTLDIIAHDVYRPSRQLITSVIKDKNAQAETFMFLDACAKFDGDESEGSPYAKAHERFRQLVPEESIFPNESLLADFTENFWAWYDKKPYVPQINDIVKLRLKESDVKLTDEQIGHFRDVVKSEKDIDRRTILALEYAKWDNRYGAVLIGEILESGIYTRYILEAWITWRACAQMSFIGPSSFTTIPNNYYDRIRVKCMNTILRHMQSTEADKYDRCILLNLAYCQILHRQGSIYGNQSLATLADLQYGMFVHPDALGHDYLKDEE